MSHLNNILYKKCDRHIYVYLYSFTYIFICTLDSFFYTIVSMFKELNAKKHLFRFD